MKPALASLLVLGLAACAVDDRDPRTAALDPAPLFDEGPLDEAAPTVPPTKLVLRADAVPNRYIVVMKTGQRRAVRDLDSAIERLATTHTAEVQARYTAALEGFAASMSDADAAALAADPDVAWVEQDAVVHTTATQNAATWGIDRVDQPTLPLDTRFKYLNAGAGVTAYVLDTGLRATHQEFTGRVMPGFTAINDGQGTNDCHFHGTHVAGTIAGKVLGVAKEANVVPVRVLDCGGSGLTSGIIAGLDWVAANRRLPAVANMSLGGPASAAEDTAVRNVIAAGVPVVVSAGNDDVDACTQSPAREPQAITVAASSNIDARASFSNFGTCVDVFAPGVDITAASFAGDTLARIVSGTSQAAPHVAGAVALYLAANPTATPAAVAQALATHAHTGKITDPKGSPNLLVNTMFVDTTRPVAAIMSPASGATVAASFQVTADVDDTNLESVRLVIDGQVVETKAAGPFAFQVSGLARGAHTIAVNATDGAGLATTSATVQVTVSSQPGQTPGPDGAGTVTAGCTAGGGSGLAVALALGLLAGRGRRRGGRRTAGNHLG
jgi:subtilisin family serine protease